MSINLETISGPCRLIKFTRQTGDATCEKKVETTVYVPIRDEVQLTQTSLGGKTAYQLRKGEYLARRTGPDQWQLVDSLKCPVDGDALKANFGVFKPGMLSRWSGNVDIVGSKQISPFTNRIVEGFIDGDLEGSWYRAFDIQMNPKGIRIDGGSENSVPVLEHQLDYRSTWTESN